MVKRSSKTNKFVSQFDPTPHMVTDVQGSRYELVADNDHNNAHFIFRHISDMKLYKPYQHPQRYYPPPSPDTNIAPLTIPLPTPLLMTLPFHTLSHLLLIIPLTTKLQLSPYQDHQIPIHNKRERERERGGHNKRNTTLPAKYADFVVNIPGRRVGNTN